MLPAQPNSGGDVLRDAKEWMRLRGGESRSQIHRAAIGEPQMLARFLTLASKALGIGLRNRQGNNPVTCESLAVSSRSRVRLGPPPERLQRTIAGWIEHAHTGGP